jgi:hypothetical protein
MWVTVRQFFVTGSSIILQVFSGIVLDFGSVSLADASPLTQLQARSPAARGVTALMARARNALL